MNKRDFLLLATSLLGMNLSASTFKFPAKADDMKPTKCVVYKEIDGVKLKLHIFNPAGHKASDKKPAIVFFFGGGWNGGSPSQFYPHCYYLASRGMVAMSAEYRVKSRNGTTPQECVKDAKSAIRWIRKNSATLGIDPDKVLASGGSAGGHLAAATGTTTAFNEDSDDLNISCIPQALVLFNPVYDNGPNGYGYSRVKAYWKEISPMENITKNTPPTIVFLGSKDKHIPIATAEKYKKLMEAKGVRCDLHVYKNQQHGFFNYPHYDNFYKTVLETDKFLISLGYLNGEPTIPEKK